MKFHHRSVAFLSVSVALALSFFPGPSALPAPFIRGDVNQDGQVDISDPIAALGMLFQGQALSSCADARDSNGDGSLDISDGVFLLTFLFLGGQHPPEPFPDCGPAPAGDQLDCMAFAGCSTSIPVEVNILFISPEDTPPVEVAYLADAVSASGADVGDFLWDFGDGGTGTGDHPSHVYQTAGEYIVTLKATDDKGATGSDSLTISIGGVSTFGRIEEALEKGEIDAETALVYKVYAEFGDSRLPARYLGDPWMEVPSRVIEEVVGKFDGLSPATQEVLQPFLLPPAAEGSWLELQEGGGGAAQKLKIEWGTVNCEHVNAKVWWQKRYSAVDENIARTMAEELDIRIWPNLKELLKGREPIPDTSQPENGGDGRLDIYLVNLRMPDCKECEGVCQSYSSSCIGRPSFILINRRRNTKPDDPRRLFPLLAHEVMHAFQGSYRLKSNCDYPGEYGWWMEATASWVEDYIYPHGIYPYGDSEHWYAPSFLNSSESLEFFEDKGTHQYGAYLFPFFLSRVKENPDSIRVIWENESLYDSLKAIDKGLEVGGGFELFWPEFATANFNRGKVDYYKRLDGLKAHKLDDYLFVNILNRDAEFPLLRQEKHKTKGIKHLSQYTEVLYFEDEEVRSVAFLNGWTYKLDKITSSAGIGYQLTALPSEEKQKRNLMAMKKVGGRWQDPEDWSEDSVKYFCRDRAEERIERLVLTYTNRDFEDRSAILKPTGLHPTIMVSNMGCWKWEATMTGTQYWNGTAKYVSIGHGIFKRLDHRESCYSYVKDSPALECYEIVEGKIDFEASGVDDVGCEHSCEAYGLPFDNSSTYLWTCNYILSPGTLYRMAIGDSLSSQEATVMMECPIGTFTTQIIPMPMMGAWIGYIPVENTGDLIQGEYEIDHLRFEWSFKALRD